MQQQKITERYDPCKEEKITDIRLLVCIYIVQEDRRCEIFLFTVPSSCYEFNSNEALCTLTAYNQSYEIEVTIRILFNVRSKADISQLNLPHETKNEKVENTKI